LTAKSNSAQALALDPIELTRLFALRQERSYFIWNPRVDLAVDRKLSGVKLAALDYYSPPANHGTLDRVGAFDWTNGVDPSK
jgi:hypothetical protein